jgi:hypothetical protein
VPSRPGVTDHDLVEVIAEGLEARPDVVALVPGDHHHRQPSLSRFGQHRQ